MNYQLSTLNNKSTLLSVNIPESLSSTFMILVKSGPIYDPKNKTGLSHFIEHLLFKGTRKYPNNEILTSILEKNGAFSEAFTYQETNSYWIKIAKENLLVAIELLTEQLQNSLFRLKDIEIEKEVIKEELNIVKSNPSSNIWELWAENIWQNTPLGRNYTGNKEEIDSFTQDDILSFFNNQYIPNKTLFVVSGEIAITEIKKSLNNKLLNYSNPNQSSIPKVEVKRINPIKICHEKNENITVGYGFLTTHRNNPDSHVLELIEFLIGRGFACRLNQKIANIGLTYSICMFSRYLSNTGYLLTNFTSHSKNVNKIIGIINDQLNEIKAGKFNEEEMERAKGYFIGQLYLHNDTSDNIAKWFGEQAIINHTTILTIKEKEEIIRKITREEFIRVANKYFTANNWYLSVIGEIDEDCFKITL